jgi:transposase
VAPYRLEHDVVFIPKGFSANNLTKMGRSDILVGMENVSPEQAYQQMRRMLNEKQWRQYLAVEAKQRGSVSQVAREAGVSINTVKRGLKELETGESYQPGERIRKAGGGKKKMVETDPTRLSDLEQELEPKGDPMSLVRLTSKSLSRLVTALEAKGHHIKKSALAEVLHAQGFSLCRDNNVPYHTIMFCTNCELKVFQKTRSLGKMTSEKPAIT